MIRYDFNNDWTVKHLGSSEEGIKVRLPYDAMLREKRSGESAGMHNVGWFAGGDYEYVHRFEVPASFEGRNVFLLFEGIYRNAEIFVNGCKAVSRPYGYTQIQTEISAYLHYGVSNEVRVVAHNADQPNSRWYSGSGIYRPVWMYVGEADYIPLYGLKVRTVSVCDYNSEHTCGKAQVEVRVRTSAAGMVSLQMTDPDGRKAAYAEEQSAAVSPDEEAVCGASDEAEESTAGIHTEKDRRAAEHFEAVFHISIDRARLWNPGRPELYRCRARFADDTSEVTFGVRELSWDAEHGMQMNGKRLLLKGCCIHSDNQLLGAETYPEAEERRVRILMENGYNAIRSAHNPASEYLLEACDRLGMLMMDEYVDCWYIHKTRFDYAGEMTKWYRADLRDMVDKDYCHPSVILYSTGNEVAETGEKRGIALTRDMTEYLHRLDGSRPVTCGVNIFFNLMYAMGFGVYSDEKAAKEAAEAEKAAQEGKERKKKKTVGSEFYNQMAGLFGDKTMKLGATLHGCDVKTRDAFAAMDVAGYNYGIYRYRHDLKKYPDRLILGSETFCSDAHDFMNLAKKNPRIVGDFVWAGMDYLGEAGIGSWEYEDYAPKDADQAGWISAGSGRVDLTGKAIGEASWTRVALEQETGPFIAVKPVYQNGRHTPSAWKMSDAIESWSWRGCTGKKAEIEVYARAERVELFLNDRKVGAARLHGNCIARFKVPYEDGVLRAVAYNGDDSRIGTCRLESAKEETTLQVIPEAAMERISGCDTPDLTGKRLTAQAGRLCYFRIRYTDRDGIWKPMEKHRVHIEVENGELKALGNACPYNPEGYLQDTVSTYYGEALAIVRVGAGGTLRLTCRDEERSRDLEMEIV